MEKSYVTLEQHICPVCLEVFDTGNLLLDSRLKATFDMHTVTGMSLCPEHQKLADDGYFFLVECAGEPQPGKELTRTGNIASVQRGALEVIFNQETVASLKDVPLAYVEVGVLQNLSEKAGVPMPARQ